MAKDTNYTEKELTKLINSEIKKFVKDEFESEIKKILAKRGGNAREEVNNIVKNGLAKFAEFMFVRKGVWQSDIK